MHFSWKNWLKKMARVAFGRTFASVRRCDDFKVRLGIGSLEDRPAHASSEQFSIRRARNWARLEIECLEHRLTPTSITAVSPLFGPMQGGTVLTITGTGFTGVTAVDFRNTPATNFTVNSATSITVTTPPDTISQSQGNDNVPILLFDGATEYVDDNTLPAPIVGAYQYQFALSPSQIRTAYGINSIQFPGGIAGNGSGQTIAIIGLGDDRQSLSGHGHGGFRNQRSRPVRFLERHTGPAEFPGDRRNRPIPSDRSARR